MEERLQLCFNTVKLDEKEVEMAIERWETRVVDSAPLKAMHRKLEDAMPVPSAIIDIIRQKIDDAFLEHLGPDAPGGLHFGNEGSREWMRAFGEYEDAVVEGVREALVAIRAAGLFESDKLSTDDRIALETCLPKLRLVTYCKCVINGIANFPFMSRSVYTHMRRQLHQIRHAILEVSTNLSVNYSDRAFQGPREMRDKHY
jgi:hypothetical protein